MAKKKRLTCRYCKMFSTALDRSINETDGKERFSRYCGIVDDRVLLGTDICEYFILNKYFWCDRCNYRLLIDVCLSRVTCHCMGKKSINKCPQRNILKKWRNDE
jgi:hypothetical protein